MSAAFEKPLLDSSSSAGGASMQGDAILQLSNIFSSYQARNVTTEFQNQYPVWRVGTSGGSTSEASSSTLALSI